MQNMRAYLLPVFLAVATPAAAQVPEPFEHLHDLSKVQPIDGGLIVIELAPEQALEARKEMFALALKGSGNGAFDLFRAANRADDNETMAMYAKIADADGDTLLHKAAKGAADKWVVLLLRHGANIEAKNAKGRTPLQEAVLEGSDNGVWAVANSAIGILIAHGADVKVKDKYGQGLVDLAAQNAWPNPALEYLLARGLVNPNDRDNDGGTAILSAISWASFENMNTLLAYGADPNVRHEKVGSPMQYFVATANKWIDGKGGTTWFTPHDGLSPDNMWDKPSKILRPRVLETLAAFIKAGGTLDGIDVQNLRPSLRGPLVRGIEARDKARAKAQVIRRSAGYDFEM